MEIRQLQHFLAVIETGSFHAAAARVNRTQQAISRSIKCLEQECGGRLLQRETRGRRVVATQFGLMLLPRAQAILAEVKDFQDQMENLMGSGRKLVRIGAAPTAARTLVPAVLPRFREQWPEHRVQILRHVTHVALERLGSGVYDLAVVDAPLDAAGPAFEAEPLFEDWHVFVAAPGHPLAGRGSLPLAALLDHDWICLGPFCRSRLHLNEDYARAKLAVPGHIVETTDIELTLGELASGRYLSFIPWRLVSEELASGALVELPAVRPDPPRWPTILLRRKNEPLAPALASFAELLRAVSAALPAAPPAAATPSPAVPGKTARPA